MAPAEAVLAIPEILVSVLETLDVRTVAVCARINTLWNCFATKLLWHGTCPLPEYEHNGEDWTTPSLDQLVDIEYLIGHRLADRMKLVNHLNIDRKKHTFLDRQDEDKPHSKKVITKLITKYIMPHCKPAYLRVTYFPSPDTPYSDERYILHLVHPGIRVLMLDGDDHSVHYLKNELWKSLPSTCPQLTDFGLHSGHNSLNVEVFGRFLLSCEHLTNLELEREYEYEKRPIIYLNGLFPIIMRLPNLKSLAIEELFSIFEADDQIIPDATRHLPIFRKFEECNIHNSSIQGLGDVLKLALHLTSIVINTSHTEAVRSALSGLTYCTKLHTVIIHFLTDTPNDPISFDDMLIDLARKLPSMRYFAFSATDAILQCVTAVSPLVLTSMAAHWPLLRHLHFCVPHTDILTIERLLEIMQQCPRLEVLNIMGARINIRSWPGLSSGVLLHLRSLFFSIDGISDIGPWKLASPDDWAYHVFPSIRATMPSLRVLGVIGYSLSSDEEVTWQEVWSDTMDELLLEDLDSDARASYRGVLSEEEDDSDADDGPDPEDGSDDDEQ